MAAEYPESFFIQVPDSYPNNITVFPLVHASKGNPMVSSASPQVLGDAERWLLKEILGGGMFRRPHASSHGFIGVKRSQRKGSRGRLVKEIRSLINVWRHGVTSGRSA